MNLSKLLRGAPMLLLLVTACTLGPVALAKTTDQSDLRWIPTESGWGIQLVQQELTIFATMMFVYGPNGQPTWYSATLDYDGSFGVSAPRGSLDRSRSHRPVATP
jgi:hypothetical protein